MIDGGYCLEPRKRTNIRPLHGCFDVEIASQFSDVSMYRVVDRGRGSLYVTTSVGRTLYRSTRRQHGDGCLRMLSTTSFIR
jgi:hypothetical protein